MSETFVRGFDPFRREGAFLVPDTFRVEMTAGEGMVRARFIGELDLATSDQIDAAVVQLLESDAARVDVDLAQLRFVDASSLRRFVELGEGLRTQGRQLVLRNPTRIVLRLLLLTGVDAVSRIEA